MNASPPPYALTVTVPRRRTTSTARLEIQNASGTALASAAGASPVSVAASGLAPAKYFAVLTPLTGAGQGTITGDYPGRVPAQTIAYDGADHATTINDGTATVTETLSPSGRVLRRRSIDTITGDVLEDTIFGYHDGGDAPVYARPFAGGATTTYVTGPGGLLVIDVSGTASYPIANGHGDLVGETDAAGVFTAYPGTDEFGVGDAPSSRLGWLGAHQRFGTGGTLRLIRMGVRLYDPALGRFLEVDPIEGGSANDYEYAMGDPVNNVDLDGQATMEADGAPGGDSYSGPVYSFPKPKKRRCGWRCGLRGLGRIAFQIGVGRVLTGALLAAMCAGTMGAGCVIAAVAIGSAMTSIADHLVYSKKRSWGRALESAAAGGILGAMSGGMTVRAGTTKWGRWLLRRWMIPWRK